jgi:hypothetical protein
VPLFVLASPASAAQNTTTASGSLSFVESNSSGWTCAASLTATHNTDDAHHPFGEITTSAPNLQNEGVVECALDVYVAEVTITCKDTGGKRDLRPDPHHRPEIAARTRRSSFVSLR